MRKEDKFDKLFHQYQKMRSDEIQREGQALFNALYTIDPSLANKLTNTDVDCFFDNSKIGSFLEEIDRKWKLK